MGQKGNHKGNENIFWTERANEDATYQNLWDAATTVLRGKLIALKE